MASPRRTTRAAAAAAAAATTTTTTTTTTNSAAAAASASGPAASYHPAQALPPTGRNPTTAIRALAALPAARTISPRDPQKALNLDRPSNREAYLGQCCGVVSATSCTHCSRSLGPWTECVVVAGLFGGSCANCHFGSEGVRCSLRPGKFSLQIVYRPKTNLTVCSACNPCCCPCHWPQFSLFRCPF